jgi:secreted trypsin-like serine protease
MTRQPFGWRALAMAAGLGTVGVGIDTASAQSFIPSGADDGVLVYERQLDLSLNPTKIGEAGPSVPETQDEVFVERSLEALVPEHDGTGRSRTRIVHGTKAQPGEWPAAVSLSILKEGARGGSLCAGTVIDSHWILTAAHCVFSRGTGGLKGLRAVTAFAKSNVPHSGEARRIKSVVVHPKYAPVARPGNGAGLINDVALLELETPTSAPRQKLAALSGQSTFLAPGTMMTVIGWGLTKPRRPDEDQDPKYLSKVLLRADVPVPERSACETFLGFTGATGESVFCAGDGKGVADSCNGDSGGPIFAKGPAGEAIQIGVVSWGDGCAMPGTYGAYATIPYFQRWIAKYVPKAQWVAPRDVKPALDIIAGVKPGGPPAPHGQVTADIRVHRCRGGTGPDVPVAANNVKGGLCLTVQVTSGATGHLVILNRDAEGALQRIFPNPHSRSALTGQAPTSVRAGQVITVPDIQDGLSGFQFEIKKDVPRGRNEVIAVIVPDAAGLADILKEFAPGRGIDGSDDLLGRIAEKTRKITVTPVTPRAVGTRQFDIVD